MKTIERVGVVGCGLMGSGIAEVSARAGLEVTVCENNQAAAEAGMLRITKSLDRAVRSGKLVKVLGTGEVSVALDITVHAFSAAAKDKIAAAGGSTTTL